MKEMAVKFYTELFISDPEARREFKNAEFLALKENRRQMIEAKYT